MRNVEHIRKGKAMFEKGKLYRNSRMKDVDMFVVGEVRKDDDFTYLKVRWFNRCYQMLMGDVDTVAIPANTYEHWKRTSDV